MALLQLGGDVLLPFTRIVKRENFSRSLPNYQIIQISLRKVGLKAIVVKNLFTPAKNTYAVGCCFQGNYFELVGPADRPAYLDNSPAVIRTVQIIAIDITLRDRQCLPGVFDKRIKANSASTGICQDDAYIGWTIVSGTEHNVEFAQRKTITSIVGSGFVKDVTNVPISQAWDVDEISVAPSRRWDDHHEQCQNLCTFAIQRITSQCLASHAAAFQGLHSVRCNTSCSTNSSTERTRIEKPQVVHLDCRKKTHSAPRDSE
jgi:hypothetical protein